MAQRVAIDDAATAGVYASDPDTIVELTDLLVQRTRAAADGTAGNGVTLFDGASVTLSRVQLDDNRQVALAIGGAAVVTVTDLVARRTAPEDASSRYGRGIELARGARLTLDRGLVEACRSAGIFLADGAELDARHLVVRDTEPEALDLSAGVGIWAQDDARVVLADARIERSRFVGVAAVAATVTATDLVVEGVSEAACAASACPYTGGFGVAAHFGGSVALSRFVVRDAALCGVVVGANDPSRPSTGMDLEDGVISVAPIGACVQAEGFDAERLHEVVAFEAVDVPLQATTYALPTSMR